MKKFISTYPATSLLMLFFLLSLATVNFMFPEIFGLFDMHGDSLARGE